VFGQEKKESGAHGAEGNRASESRQGARGTGSEIDIVVEDAAGELFREKVGRTCANRCSFIELGPGGDRGGVYPI